MGKTKERKKAEKEREKQHGEKEEKGGRLRKRRREGGRKGERPCVLGFTRQTRIVASPGERGGM